jgi:uncharacterized protein
MLAHDLFACERYKPLKAQTVRELLEADLRRALELLGEDPLHGVHLRSMLEDNGLVHPSNRGRFHGYFEDGQLVGIALLGHTIMIYARPEAEHEALAFFAQKANEVKAPGNVIFGPRQQVEIFWSYLADKGRVTKMVRDFGWYVCQKPRLAVESLQLRRANQDELAPIATAQAKMLEEATGTNPNDTDPEGFVQRVAERINRNRTWIRLENNEVIFKTELQSVTPEVVYIEGVWTREDQREQGVAKQCLTELAHRLLRQHKTLCLAVEPKEEAAIKLYEQVGFVCAEYYQARYLMPLTAE